MSEFKVNLTAVNPKEEDRCTPPVEVKVMVDNIGHRFVALTAVSCPAHTAVSAMNR